MSSTTPAPDDGLPPRHRAPGGGGDAPGGDTAPPVPHTRRGPMVVAGILLLIPVVALVWVPSYNQVDPTLWGFPFFFWYQFLWVFLCAAATGTAYRLTLAARR